jgi:hypothetical protein
MEFDNRDVVATRRAYWLNRCIYWLDCCWDSSGEVGIESTRIRSEGCDLHAKYRITCQDIDEPASIAVANSEDAGYVHTVACGDVGDECIHKPKIIHVAVCATWCPCWV